MSTLAVLLEFLRRLPLWLARVAGRLLLLLYLALSPRVRREVSDNFQSLFGRAAGSFWLKLAWRLGSNLALMTRLGRPELDKLLDKTRFHSENGVEQNMLASDRTVVITLHYGLWELLPSTFARRGFQTCVGYASQRDALLGDRILQIRAAKGVSNTSRTEEMRQAVRDGKLVGFVLDNTNRIRGASCNTLLPGLSLLRTPFVLARAEQARVVPMLMRAGNEGFEVDIGKPVATAEEFGTWARTRIEAHPEDWVFWGKKVLRA